MDTKQQILQQIKNAQNILICFKDIKHGTGYPAGGDAVASALALQNFLRKNGKAADIASPNFSLPAHFSFLPGADAIKKEIISTSPIDSGKKFLYIYPAGGNYDLIITLDMADLAFLGDIYERNRVLFRSTLIINIDNSPENQCYGAINLIDAESSSVAEIIWQIIEDNRHLNENIIDCVLAGIIAKTKNFRRPNIGPKTLEIAGELIKLGAKRQNIVENFYRTKSVNALRLWGRALARLKREDNLVWSVLQRADFIHSGATETELEGVIHELISNSPDAKIIALLFEGIDGAIKTITYSGNKLAHTILPHSNLIIAEKEFLMELKKADSSPFCAP